MHLKKWYTKTPTHTFGSRIIGHFYASYKCCWRVDTLFFSIVLFCGLWVFLHFIGQMCTVNKGTLGFYYLVPPSWWEQCPDKSDSLMSLSLNGLHSLDGCHYASHNYDAKKSFASYCYSAVFFLYFFVSSPALSSLLLIYMAAKALIYLGCCYIVWG